MSDITDDSLLAVSLLIPLFFPYPPNYAWFHQPVNQFLTSLPSSFPSPAALPYLISKPHTVGTDVDNNVPITLNDDGTVSPLHCPPDYFELSRSTWTYLHTMAAYYPEEPTDGMKQHVTNLLTSFPYLYPCPQCKDHMISYIDKYPIPTTNNRELSVWMCELHNDVNKWQGKRLVQCSADYLIQRYKDGYGDERC